MIISGLSSCKRPRGHHLTTSKSERGSEATFYMSGCCSTIPELGHMKLASSIFYAQSLTSIRFHEVATATMHFRVTSLPRPPFAPFSQFQPQRLARHPAQSIQQVHTNTAQALTADVLSCHAENTLQDLHCFL